MMGNILTICFGIPSRDIESEWMSKADQVLKASRERLIRKVFFVLFRLPKRELILDSMNSTFLDSSHWTLIWGKPAELEAKITTWWCMASSNGKPEVDELFSRHFRSPQPARLSHLLHRLVEDERRCEIPIVCHVSWRDLAQASRPDETNFALVIWCSLISTRWSQ